MEKGCNMGNIIYPNTTGLFNVPFNSDVERFYPTNPIDIRTWDNDPKCGIRDNKLVLTNQRCIVNNQYGAGIIYYNSYDIKYDCKPILETPFDYSIILLTIYLIVGIYGFIKITKDPYD